jgi:predicted nucleic acid-binding Zn ribbon protein
MSTWQPARPPRRLADPRPVGESLAVLARAFGAPPPPVLSAVFSRWVDLVGPAVADHTRPVALRDGVLTIAADQPAWATQLRLLTGELLRRLATVDDGEAVAELRVVVRRDAAR